MAAEAAVRDLALTPLSYLVSMLWAWWRRDAIRAKRRVRFGQFSLWFPLVTTLVIAWVLCSLVPSLFGLPLTTLSLFQPDLAIILVASAASGVAWAAFRLAVGYTGSPTSGPARRTHQGQSG